MRGIRILAFSLMGESIASRGCAVGHELLLARGTPQRTESVAPQDNYNYNNRMFSPDLAVSAFLVCLQMGAAS